MNAALKSTLSNEPLEVINLSVRPHNALRRAGLVSVLDVCEAIDDGSIWAIPNIGPKSTEEIIQLTDQLLSAYSSSNSSGNQIDTHNFYSWEPDMASYEFSLPDIKIVSDIPLDFLKSFIGIQTVEKLLSIDVQKVRDLDQILRQYLDFLLPGNLLLDKTIELISQEIIALISQGKISPKIIIESMPLIEYLNWFPAGSEEKSIKIQVIKRILSENSLTDEINRLFRYLTDRQRDFFLDYSLHNFTLEEIGEKQHEPVTRERVRQVLRDATKMLSNAINSSLKIYISTALEVANEMGISLSRDGWKSELIKRSILLDDDQDYQSFDLFWALLKNKFTSKSILGISKNVHLILKDQQSHPIYVMNALSGRQKKKYREVSRIVKFTGGIAKAHAEQILGLNSEKTVGILKALKIEEVTPDWFTTVSKIELNKNAPLFRAGLIMMQACGPLPFESFCDGLRRYISRHYDTLAPTEVVKKLISNFGFHIENDIVTYYGDEKIRLSTSESLLMELLSEKGPVLNFQEIVEFYLSKGKSFATATTKIMPGSPIIEKIEQGLYKLRGSSVSWKDIETGKSRQEEFSRNAEVTYGLDGIIRYRITVGSWQAGGTLNISRSCQPLPDFCHGWPVFVNNIESGIARRDDNFIWGLSPAFTLLGVKFGDRIELAFDTWNKPKINIRIVEEENA